MYISRTSNGHTLQECMHCTERTMFFFACGQPMVVVGRIHHLSILHHHRCGHIFHVHVNFMRQCEHQWATYRTTNRSIVKSESVGVETKRLHRTEHIRLVRRSHTRARKCNTCKAQRIWLTQSKRASIEMYRNAICNWQNRRRHLMNETGTYTTHTHPVTWSIRFILPKTTIPFNIFDIKLNENLVSPIYMFHQNLTTNDTNAVCWNARNRSRLISRRLLSLVLDFGKCCAEQNKILNKK